MNSSDSIWILVGNCCLFPLCMIGVGWWLRGLRSRNARLQWPIRVDAPQKEDKITYQKAAIRQAAQQRPPEDRMRLGGGGQ